MEKFEDALRQWQQRKLTQAEAARLLNCSVRTFRRDVDDYAAYGLDGLRDGRLGKASGRAIGFDERQRMIGLYKRHHQGWNAKHFHEYGGVHYAFSWGYTWTKSVLQSAGLIERAPKRGAHRKKRERKPMAGMMLHQDGSRHAWLDGHAPLDLIVTMDDATSEIYSAFLVEEEGTVSTFVACREVFLAHGLPCSFYTDRGSHYFTTPEAGGKVDKAKLTAVGEAFRQLGVTHIPAYSPEARGRSERMFGTLQDRLVKELALAGIRDVGEANRWIASDYLPRHNAQFAVRATTAGSAFVVKDRASIVEALAIEEERVVSRDNTVSYDGKRLQIPESPVRAHYVKATVKVRQYPDGRLAIFHGPRRIADFDANGLPAGEDVRAEQTARRSIPAAASVPRAGTASRRGLATAERAAKSEQRPSLTRSRPVAKVRHAENASRGVEHAP